MSAWPIKARGYRRDTRGGLNKMEAEYASILDLRQRAGEIAWYKREGIRLRLADNTMFGPDFAVMLADGTIELHEVKGHMEEAAWVRLRVAVAQFPFRFLLCRKVKGQWDIQEVGE